MHVCEQMQIQDTLLNSVEWIPVSVSSSCHFNIKYQYFEGNDIKFSTVVLNEKHVVK